MKQEVYKLISTKLAQGSLLSFTDLVSNYRIDHEDLKSDFNWYDKVVSLGWLKELLTENEGFEEIIVHSSNNILIKDTSGTNRVGFELSKDDLELSYEILTINNKVQWNFNSPVTSFQYLHNHKRYRLTLLHYSATPSKCSKLFIRSTPNTVLDLSSFMHSSCEKYIKESISMKKNIIISGANSSGKTTLLKSLIQLIPDSQHLVILEDFNELSVNSKNVTHLIENKKNASKTLASYCAHSLRMATDRLVIGEIRSSEIVPFLLAINTGTEGVFTTVHSNSARDTIDRMALLFSLYSSQTQINHSKIEKMICQSIDVIIYLKNKKVDHIIELCGFSDGRPLYKSINSNYQDHYETQIKSTQ